MPIESLVNPEKPDNLIVAMVSPYDSRDIRKASGTGYHMAEGLEQAGLTIERIGPLKPQRNPINILRYLWNAKVRGLNDHPQRDPGFLRNYARQVERALEQSNAQVVLGAGGLPLAYLRTDLPMVLWTDCTFAGLLNYYAKYSNLSARTERDGHACDQSLFDRIDMAIFPSEWARATAADAYGFPREKVRLISRGAGVACDRTADDIERLIEARPEDTCRLLWVGVDWERKGGGIALDAARLLSERGIDVAMHIVGVQPPAGIDLPSWVTLHGYLDKRDPAQRATLDGLFASSHFFLLPTQAEAYGIVFCEASSFGLPSIATRTGGTGDAIREGVTGWTLPPEEPPSAYADRIESCFKDRAQYAAIARSAFADFTDRTNWGVVCEQAAAAIRELVRTGPTSKPNDNDRPQRTAAGARASEPVQ